MLTLQINGQSRTLDISPGATLDKVLDGFSIKADRVAVERNGIIAPRSSWPTMVVVTGDRLEIVHFVGGGAI
jgi:sulfur carrier protein